MALTVPVCLFTHTTIMGGSMDREATALAVMPKFVPSCLDVITVTPLAKRP